MNEVLEPPAVTIRQPATANLMVDSADRTLANFPLASAFQITKPQALLNGFFHRVGATEVTLEWYTPNLLPQSMTIDISGGTGVTGTSLGNTLNITAPTFATQETLIDLIRFQLNLILNPPAPGVPPLTPAPTININTLIPAGAQFTSTQPIYLRVNGALAIKLGMPINVWIPIDTFGVGGGYTLFPPVDLRRFRYLDFVSAQLTYNQDVKDSATNAYVRDVLVRWYMAYDEAPQLDAYGYPILMGYTPFTLRRLFNPPKQIKWDSIQPVGNLAFEVWTNTNILVPFTAADNWLMTLQISEN